METNLPPINPNIPDQNQNKVGLKKIIATSLIVGGVLIILALLYIYLPVISKSLFHKSEETKRVPSAAKNNTKNIENVSESQEQLSRLSKLTMPSDYQKSAIQLKLLPAELSPLIMPNASNIEIFKITYSEKGNGYLINFILPGQKIPGNLSVIRNLLKDWGFVSGARKNLAAVEERENKDMKLRMTITQQNTDFQKVSIQTLAK